MCYLGHFCFTQVGTLLVMLYFQIFSIASQLCIPFLGHLFGAGQVEHACWVGVTVLAIDFEHLNANLLVLVAGDLPIFHLLPDDVLWGEVLNHIGVFECEPGRFVIFEAGRPFGFLAVFLHETVHLFDELGVDGIDSLQGLLAFSLVSACHGVSLLAKFLPLVLEEILKEVIEVSLGEDWRHRVVNVTGDQIILETELDEHLDGQDTEGISALAALNNLSQETISI